MHSKKYFWELDFHILCNMGVIILITSVVALLVNLFIERYIKQKLIHQEKDTTTLQFLKRILITIIYLIGIAVALSQIPELKILGHSLLAGAGIFSVIMGLATQQSLRNLFSGLMIVIFKPLKINDRVTIKGYTGVVEDINLRQIIIRDFYNNRIVFPNSVVNDEVIINNEMVDSKTCKHLEFGISYSSDIDLAMKIIEEEALNHPLIIDNRSESDKQNNASIVKVRLVALNDSNITIRAWIWAKNSSDLSAMYYDLLKTIKERFDKDGIKLPFPQRTISYLSPLQ